MDLGLLHCHKSLRCVCLRTNFAAARPKDRMQVFGTLCFVLFFLMPPWWQVALQSVSSKLTPPATPRCEKHQLTSDASLWYCLYRWLIAIRTPSYAYLSTTADQVHGRVRWHAGVCRQKNEKSCQRCEFFREEPEQFAFHFSFLRNPSQQALMFKSNVWL